MRFTVNLLCGSIQSAHCELLAENTPSLSPLAAGWAGAMPPGVGLLCLSLSLVLGSCFFLSLFFSFSSPLLFFWPAGLFIRASQRRD